MSSVIQTLSGAIATPYQANITVPNWMLGSMERVMQYYVDKNLRLDTLSAEMMPAPVEGKKYMLYAHIPFCHTLCSYCTFHRFMFKEDKARAYFISLRKEMEMVKALGYDFESMYIGGGTTTVLEDELASTIEHAKTLFPSIKEVSCESDPQHLDSPGFKQLKGLVDRMSIGVQSFNDDILKMTDRLDKFGTGQQTFDKITPHQTTTDELKRLKLDPALNQNVAILNYSDVLRRFIPSPATDTRNRRITRAFWSLI